MAVTPAASSPTTTLTPRPALGSVGPYVAYMRNVSGVYSAVLADLYDLGRRETSLPDDVGGQMEYDLHSFANPASGISSDGLYYAYEVGASEAPYDLRLKILSLRDALPAASIPLLAEDMPAKLEELASAAHTDLSRELGDVPVELWQDELLNSLKDGIRTFAWSPTSPTIAFAAQIDGPSSDLYTLDLPSMTRRRLTSGLQNLQRLSWSPNGQWIAHGSAFVVGMGSPIHNFIVAVDGGTLLTLPEGGLQSDGWVTSQWYLLNEAANGPGSFDLKAVQPPDPHFVTLWKYPFNAFALDLGGGSALVSVGESWDFSSGPGSYLANIATGSYERVHGTFVEVFTWGRGADRFLGADDTGVYSVSESGQARLISEGRARVAVSPNREMIVLFPGLGQGTTSLYDAVTGRTTHVADGPTSCVVWSPDSRLIYVASQRTLSVFDIAKGDLSAIDDNLVGDGSICPIRIVAK